jgi:probable HAF family extracellular repeat protein
MVGIGVGGIQAVLAASDRFIVLDPYDPRGINDRGEIVGGYTDANGLHGFVLSKGTVTTIDGPPGDFIPFPNAPQTLAYSINDRGEVVGVYVSSVLDPNGSHTESHGFLWSEGTRTTIDIPGSTFTEAHGINDRGEIVGSYTDASGTPHGFLLSKGTLTEIIDPNSTDVPIPFGIHNRGDIVGGLGGQGFVFSKGRFTMINVPGSVGTETRGINDHGEIVGFWMDAEGMIHGYLFSKGRFTEIQVPGSSLTEVFGGQQSAPGCGRLRRRCEWGAARVCHEGG